MGETNVSQVTVPPEDREPKPDAAARRGFASTVTLNERIRDLRRRGVTIRTGYGWVSRTDLDAALAGRPVEDRVVMVPVLLSDLMRVVGREGEK